MKILKKLVDYGLIIILAMGVLAGLPHRVLGETDAELKSYYARQMQKPDYDTVKAKVLGIPFDDTQIDKPGVPRVSDFRYQHLRLVILTGKHRGEFFTVKNTIEMINPYKLIIENGETILLRLYEDPDGNVENLVVYERSKEIYLYGLIALFMLLLVFIGGMKGFKSVITLLLTVVMVIFVLLPLLLRGWNPILLSTAICISVVALTLLIINGWNQKTFTAFLGTVGGVIMAGLLALISGSICKLSGLGNEDAQLLAYIPQYMNFDYKGLLFAGIIIGALGAITDVTMSVASAMWEIVQVQSALSWKGLVKSGMNIGRDIMGSMANTLILAYVGGSIHILLLLITFNVPLLEVINMDLMATEIVRAIAGSIGLICAIPLTAFLCGMFYKQSGKPMSVSKRALNS